MGRTYTAIPIAIYLGASCLLLAILHHDLRPPPVYDHLSAHSEPPALPILAQAPLEVALDAPGTAPDRLSIPMVIATASHPLEIALYDAGSGALLAERRVDRSGVVRIELGDALRGVERIGMVFRSAARRPERAPLVPWAGSAPGYDAAVTLAGAALSEQASLPRTGPLFRWSFPWPTRWLLLGWLLVAPCFAWACREPRRHLAFLALLSLVAATTSVLLWQAHYSRFFQHYDADDYARAAQTIARFLTEPGARDEARAWLRDHPHSSTSLVPALLAPVVALGVPPQVAYMELSALASFLALLLFHRLLRTEQSLSPVAALALTAAFGSHLLMLRSFARPITDAFGLLLVLATLGLLLARLRHGSGRWNLALSALVFLHPLGRPQGFGYWLFVGAALFACDRWRAGGRLPRREALRTQLVTFGPPLLLLAALYVHFDWLHNTKLMLEKAARFRPSSSAWFLFPSLVGTFQLLPALWPWSRRALRGPATRLWVAWIAFTFVLLSAARAPFWMRHFLPTLPAIFALAAAGRAMLERRWRPAGMALLLLTSVANVAASLYLIFAEPNPSLALERFISSP